MNIAICDDDIEFCTTLKRQLTDCLQYNDIIDIYYRYNSYFYYLVK